MSNEEVQASLKRKEEIDAMASGQFVERQRWLVEAVELLLRIQIQKEKDKHK